MRKIIYILSDIGFLALLAALFYFFMWVTGEAGGIVEPPEPLPPVLIPTCDWFCEQRLADVDRDDTPPAPPPAPPMPPMPMPCTGHPCQD